MVASVQAICDYILNDLQTNVTGVTNAKPHRYVPWTLEKMAATRDARHISVHINAEEAIDYETNSRYLYEHIEVLIWEDAVGEGSYRVNDDARDLAWIQLFEAVRARFFVTAMWTLGNMAGIDECRYERAVFQGGATVRAMSLIASLKTQDAFT